MDKHSTFKDLAASRYSVRDFADTPVSQKDIDQLLEIARIAPTACNNQPQRISVITAPDELAMIDECTPCRFGAPLVFVVCYDDDACWSRPMDGEKSGVVDASIVTTHLMLEAANIGLGSVWVMFFDPAKLAELFKLPKNIVPVARRPVGHPAPDAQPNPQHSTKQPLTDLLL
jgi:nitroreductase